MSEPISKPNLLSSLSERTYNELINSTRHKNLLTGYSFYFHESVVNGNAEYKRKLALKIQKLGGVNSLNLVIKDNSIIVLGDDLVTKPFKGLNV
jgi:hypothetical protein